MAPKSTASVHQEQLKQVPSIHASRQHEDYEYDYDGRIAPPLEVNRVVRRHITTTTTTCNGHECESRYCSNCEATPRTHIQIQNIHQVKEKEDDGLITGKTVMTALLGAAAGAAAAYALFSAFSGKEEKAEVKEEPIRMYARPASVVSRPAPSVVSRPGSVFGDNFVPERAQSLSVIDEGRRTNYDMEARLAIMPPPPDFDENVWGAKVKAKMNGSQVSSSGRRLAGDTLVDEDGKVMGDATDDGRKSVIAGSSVSRSKSYVSARSHASTGTSKLRNDHEMREPVTVESCSESEPETQVRASASHVSAQPIARAESVTSHRSRRSHRSSRDVAESEVSHGSRDSQGRRRRRKHTSGSTTSHSREEGARSHVSTSRNDEGGQSPQGSPPRDPHEILRETEYSTDAIIGANFASQIAAIAGSRHSPSPPSTVFASPYKTTNAPNNTQKPKLRYFFRKKSLNNVEKEETGSHVSAREVPLPDSDARSCMTARDIPLPESEVGGARVLGGVYGGGGCGMGLGGKMSARFVALPDSVVPSEGGGSEVGSEVFPEDSISNVGGRRRRRRKD